MLKEETFFLERFLPIRVIIPPKFYGRLPLLQRQKDFEKGALHINVCPFLENGLEVVRIVGFKAQFRAIPSHLKSLSKVYRKQHFP
jgi:hypothetical protein